jgi:rhodanese-related sulfurtransferase
MKPLILLLTLLFTTTSALADKPVAPEAIPGTQLITAEQLVELINSTPGLVIIDARHHEEYARGHIEGAIFMLDTDMTPGKLGSKVHSKETPLVFYCNGERCARSTNASKKAMSWGYKRIYWFRGGWQEWHSKGLPVSR